MRISDWSSDVCSSDLRSPEDGVSDARCTHVTRDRRSGLSFDVKVVRAGFASQSDIDQAVDRFRPAFAQRGAQVDMVVLAQAHIDAPLDGQAEDRKSTRLNSSH